MLRDEAVGLGAFGGVKAIFVMEEGKIHPIRQYRRVYLYEGGCNSPQYLTTRPDV